MLIYPDKNCDKTSVQQQMQLCHPFIHQEKRAHCPGTMAGFIITSK